MLNANLAQTTQPEFKVVMPFTLWGIVTRFVSMWATIIAKLPCWAYVCVIVVITARLIFGPLGNTPRDRGSRRRRR